jgi:hypothetical protein
MIYTNVFRRALLCLQFAFAVSVSADILNDKYLVRYYPFENGSGGWADQLAGKGEGRLMLVGNSPYGEPEDRRMDKWGGPVVGTEWHQGRAPGTWSIRPGEGRESVIRSQFYGTDTGTFSIEAWVRPHSSIGPYIWAGSVHDNGFALQREYNHLVWRVVTADGVVIVRTQKLPDGLWHQVVAEWDDSTLTARLYVNGLVVGETKGSSGYVAPSGSKELGGNPLIDYDGLRIGGLRSSQVGALRFDIDELLIYSRVLNSDEIATRYRDGAPRGTAEEQLAQFHAEMQREEVYNAIRLDIPKDTFGYFPKDSRLDLTVSVPANKVWSGDLKAAWSVEDLAGKVIGTGANSLAVSPDKGASLSAELSFPEYGLYFVKISLVDAAGSLIKKQEYPVGIIVSLPDQKDMPKTSPLASHGIIERSPEGLELGFGVADRFIRGWEWKAPGKYDFDYSDKVIDQAHGRGMNVMFCFNRVPVSWDENPDSSKFNMYHFKEYLTELVRRYKDKVQYWEVLNEPNSSHHQKTLGGGLERAKNYVKVLKAAAEVIRREDPDGVIVGISGCPGFEVWTEQVLAAGGAPYFDVVSIHNYRSVPIQNSARQDPIGRVRAALDRYGKVAPIWNGEFGFMKSPRIDGRPMDVEQLKAFHGGRVTSRYGVSFINSYMPIWTENSVAAWTLQTIMLDLGDGCSRVFLLAGAGGVFPHYVGTGLPSEQGVAMAALASRLISMKGAGRLPMASLRDACVLIESEDGNRDAAVFSDDKTELFFRVPGRQSMHGMDMLGNPMSWPVDENGVICIQADLRPVFLFNVPQGFAQIPLLAIGVEDQLQKGKTKGILTLTNPSNQPIVYHLEADLPKELTLECETQIKVAAYSERKLPFTLTENGLKRGQHELGFSLLNNQGKLLGKAQRLLNAQSTMVMIPKMNNEISLRANPSDWEGIKPVVIDDVGYVLSGKPIPGFPWSPQWLDASDLSFSYRVAWNVAQGLLFFIEVTDNKTRVAPDDQLNRMFQYDCVELFLDTRPLKLRSASYASGVDQIMVRPSLTDEAAPCSVIVAGGKSSQVETQFFGRRTKTGYIIEGRIGPNAKAPWNFEAGMPLALDMIVDDADETLRKAVMGIGYGGLNNSRDTSPWGWYELSKD